MATNDDVGPKRPDEPWWSQTRLAAEGGASAKPPQGGSTVSFVGGTVAQTSGQMGMPTEFGRYRVRKQLGGGGMGAVYLVENTELRREEALKVPHFGIGDDPEVRERFVREARAAAKLDHPNLCPVYDVGEINGVCFLTMRYLKGKLLSDYTGKPQPLRKAVEITAKLAQALESAHSKGVIHRDLKPNNVMMCAGVGPVVMDFGLAKQTKSEDQKLTQAGTTMGTPSYMPPEQVKGELDRIGPASDVYSLGVILFEMLTGRLPFKAATVAEVYGMVLHTAAPAPSLLRPGLDPALDAICAKALAKTPEGRYPSMKAFAAALIDFLKTAPVAERAGDLTPMKAGPAEIFQALTVAPNQAAISTPALLGEPTQRGNKAPSSIRKPASTHRATPQVTVSAAEKKEGRSVAGVLGLLALILLMLGALGGVGYLVYAVSQKKAVPSADGVVAATRDNPAAGDPLALDLGGGVTVQFVRVPKGTFWMGWTSDKKQSKQVTIDKDFELGVYTVTQEQWQALMLDNPSAFSHFGIGKDKVANVSGADLKRFPVENVSWHDAQGFLRKLNAREDGKGWLYRLPREAEWEYACRNAATTKEECSFDFYFDRGTNDLSSNQANFNQGEPCN
ncbi:MAG TPA: hypothetical protein DDY78_17650 [Planctomycetales bacterium]|jgi:serine/threonine protein kinase|nr:hypothetical protein [Planctomycetales bacterium]